MRFRAWVTAPLCLMLFAVPLVYLRGIYEYSLLPKLLVFHLCVALACAGWLVRTRFRRGLRLVSGPTILPAMCLLASAMFSAWSTTHPLDSLVELSTLATLIILFFVVANVFPFRVIPAMLWTTAAVGLAVSAIGILQYHGLAFLWIRSNALPSATFANRNLAAEYLICAIPLAGALFLTARRLGALLFSGLSASLMGVFLVYTRTRSAWMGLAAAILILGGTLVLWSGLRRSALEGVKAEMTRRKWAVACGFLIAFAILSSLPPRRTTSTFMASEKADISSTASSIFEKEALKDDSVTQRLAFWKGTLHMIADHPLLGVGPGGWIREYPPYDGGATISADGYHRRPHNDYLWIASEYGLFGLGLYVWFLVAGFGCLVKMARSLDSSLRIVALTFAISLLSLSGAAFFGFPRELPQTAMFPCLLLGIATGATTWGAKVLRPKALGPVLLVALVVICLVGAELSRRRIEFDRHYLRAYSWAAVSGWGPVLSEADRALGYGAFRSDVLFIKGLAFQNMGRYEEAGQAYRKTLTYSPHAWYAHDALAFMDLLKGRIQEARDHYQTALSICPGAPFVRTNLLWIERALRAEKPNIGHGP